jgi:hypothetical protein
MNKKGAIFAMIVGVIALLVIFWFIVDLATRECSTDKECGDERYCGSDYKCHDFPTITKHSYIIPAIIIGISIIIAAYVLKKRPIVKQHL